LNIHGYKSRVSIDYGSGLTARVNTITATLKIKEFQIKEDDILFGNWTAIIDRMSQSILVSSAHIISPYYIGSITASSIISEYSNITNIDKINRPKYKPYYAGVNIDDSEYITLEPGVYKNPIQISGSFAGALYNTEIDFTEYMSGSYISDISNKRYNTIFATESISLVSQEI